MRTTCTLSSGCLAEKARTAPVTVIPGMKPTVNADDPCAACWTRRLQSLRGGQQGPRVLQQLTAGGRQLGGLLVPGEQLRAQLLLQRADLPGQHRLRDVQPLGGPAEVQLLGHGHEVAQLAQIDIHDISSGADAPPHA